jgi:hypothetical protein
MQIPLSQKPVSTASAARGLAAAVTPAVNDAAPPPQAARGDDDVMSQPPRSSLKRSVDNATWQRQIDRAGKTWSKLNEADLGKVAGDAGKLAALLRQHYAFSSAETDSQIDTFFNGI